MPPKKDESAGTQAITNFNDRETKLLAAAFVSAIGPDKYDFALFASLTGNTAGSLKKMWPPVKRKAVEAHPSFAAFLGVTPTASDEANGTKAAGGKEGKAAAAKKRKQTDEPDDGQEYVEGEGGANGEKKKAPAKGRGRKKFKSEEASDGDEGDAEKKAAPTTKGRGRKKIKTEDEANSEYDASPGPNDASVEADSKKKAPAKSRAGRKKAAVPEEEKEEDEDQVKEDDTLEDAPPTSPIDGAQEEI
ncbi:hypothetical protein N0V90_011874 [Kalmusia sp. IMI 367209]|nr:hypothetical protein N0V90_011874 [Kalmusia sp. IMI 367209]